jgi:hypothetical protein
VLVINYVPPPVRVVLDQLEPAPKGRAIPANLGADGRLVHAAPKARLWLDGRVVWDQAEDERLAGVEWVRVRVNGVQQVGRVRLQEPAKKGARARAFRVEVLLSRPKDNRIDVDVPGLDLEDGGGGAYRVDCARPEQEKRFLHLLVIAAGKHDPAKLTGRLLEALRAKPVTGREFTLRHFERGRLYGPLTGSIDPAKVYYQLASIRRQIDLLARQEPTSHVVLVYYQGQEAISAQGHLLRTSSRQADPGLGRYAIGCGELEEGLSETLGAKILLLDVQREGAAQAADQDRVAHWPAGSYVAVMRYARLGRDGGRAQAPLIEAWEEALRRVNKLKEVDEQVARKYEALKRRQPLLYNGFIPQGLWDLVIGP